MPENDVEFNFGENVPKPEVDLGSLLVPPYALTEEEQKREIEFHSWNQKIWGKTKCLVRSPFYFRHELHVVQGSFCSFHYHHHRSNRFQVKSGIIRIVWSYGWSLGHKVLTPGMQFDVCSSVPHQFQVLQDGVVFEEYWTEKNIALEEQDIIRLSIGGLSDLVYENTPRIFNESGETWQGGIEWNQHTQPSLESTVQESDNSD